MKIDYLKTGKLIINFPNTVFMGSGNIKMANINCEKNKFEFKEIIFMKFASMKISFSDL